MQTDYEPSLPLTAHATQATVPLVDDFFAQHEGRAQAGRLSAQVDCVPKGTEAYALRIRLKGDVTVTCDRCLSPLTLSLSTDDTLSVCIGDEDGDDGDTITVSRRTMRLPLAPALHQMVELALPYRLCHPAGQCDPSMERILAQHIPDDGGGDTEETNQQ